MTPKKRREWARVFLSARRHGLGGLKLILFSVACAWEMGAAAPFLLAARVMRRATPARVRWRRMRPVWHPPLTWAPRAVGAIAVSIALWGLLMFGVGGVPMEVEDVEVPEWLLVDRGDAGVVAKKMPTKRMKKQQAPPCDATQVQLNDACWLEVVLPPPCGDFYEQTGRCYVPIVEKKRAPTSVDP